jgi:DNA-binding transcriptional LysR family regulator
MMQGNHFSKLSAFVAVAEHRRFSKAAAQLGISPSTLTQAIQALEDYLGVRLLNRTTRSVSLTSAGDQLLHQMQPVIAAVEDALEAMNSFRDSPRGTLRLSVVRAAAKMMIAPLLPGFLREYPDISLEIVTDDSEADIVNERIDAGIRVREWIEKDMVALRIFDEYRMVTVASPAYLSANPAITAPEDLRAHNCIQRRWTKDGAIHPWEYESNGRRSQVVVGGSLVVNDPHLILQAAIDGVGIGYLAEMAVAEARSQGELVSVLDDWAPRMSGLFLYYSSRRHLPAPLKVFIDFMRRHRAAIQAGQIILPAATDIIPSAETRPSPESGSISHPSEMLLGARLVGGRGRPVEPI